MILFRAGPIQQATYAEAALPEEGFAFNINGKLSPTFYAPLTAAIDCVQGTLTIGILSFILANMVAVPGRTTHFRINSAGVEIDFEQKVYTFNNGSTVDLL